MFVLTVLSNFVLSSATSSHKGRNNNCHGLILALTLTLSAPNSDNLINLSSSVKASSFVNSPLTKPSLAAWASLLRLKARLSMIAQFPQTSNPGIDPIVLYPTLPLKYFLRLIIVLFQMISELERQALVLGY